MYYSIRTPSLKSTKLWPYPVRLDRRAMDRTNGHHSKRTVNCHPEQKNTRNHEEKEVMRMYEQVDPTCPRIASLRTAGQTSAPRDHKRESNSLISGLCRLSATSLVEILNHKLYNKRILAYLSRDRNYSITTHCWPLHVPTTDNGNAWLFLIE